MTIVKRKHLAQGQMCARISRKWFKHHGFDWSDFLKNGISAEKLRSIGRDYYVERAVRIAEKDKS